MKFIPPVINDAENKTVQFPAGTQIQTSAPVRSHTKRRRAAKSTNPSPIPEKVLAELKVNFDLEKYLAYFPQVTEAGKVYLRSCLDRIHHEPSGTSNVTRYVGLKTNLTYTAESDNGELPLPIMADVMDDVIYYAEQAGKLPIVYKSGSSTISTFGQPDGIFFTVYGPKLVEGKTARKAAQLSASNPGKYTMAANGTVRCPPLELAAKELGMTAEVKTEANYSRTFLENQQLLTPYYRKELRNPITESERQAIRSAITVEPGIAAANLPITQCTSVRYAPAGRSAEWKFFRRYRGGENRAGLSTVAGDCVLAGGTVKHPYLISVACHTR